MLASFIPSCFLTGKYKDSVGQKAHRLKSIYVKITETACVSDELCRLLKKKKKKKKKKKLDKS